MPDWKQFLDKHCAGWTNKKYYRAEFILKDGVTADYIEEQFNLNDIHGFAYIHRENRKAPGKTALVIFYPHTQDEWVSYFIEEIYNVKFGVSSRTVNVEDVYPFICDQSKRMLDVWKNKRQLQSQIVLTLN
jgi:hypothetical protein